MSTAMSNPDVQPIAPSDYTPSHDCNGHIVQLYTDDRFLLDVLSRFIGGALAVGDGAVVVATASHLRDLTKLLSARGLDTDKATAQGRYLALDAGETLKNV